MAQAAMAMGLPELAKVFYYGKEFGTKKQRLNEKGQLVEEEYKPLSVTKAGAEGDEPEYTTEAVLPEEKGAVAKESKVSENDVNGLLDHILGKSGDSASLDEILNIVKGA